jgi:hypothetical protein
MVQEEELSIVKGESKVWSRGKIRYCFGAKTMHNSGPKLCF